MLKPTCPHCNADLAALAAKLAREHGQPFELLVSCPQCCRRVRLTWHYAIVLQKVEATKE